MQIDVTFIVNSRDELIAPLTEIFNQILHLGHVPRAWKMSYLVPIPKKGDVKHIGNYRGIALQSVIPKIFDKLLTATLYGHMSDLIPPEQHGFMKGKSTITNLMEITHFIQLAIKERKQVDVIYLEHSTPSVTEFWHENWQNWRSRHSCTKPLCHL